MEYSDDQVQTVWEQGRATMDRDPGEWRKDQCGAWLQRAQYNTDAEFGWKIEAVRTGNPAVLGNLQPVHWRNGFDVENGKPLCRVTADRAGLRSTQYVDQPRNEPRWGARLSVNHESMIGSGT